VEVESAPRKARGVVDAHPIDGPADAGHRSWREDGGREELEERLYPVEPSRRGARAYRHAAAADLQTISLVGKSLRARARQVNPGTAPAGGAGTEPETRAHLPEPTRGRLARGAAHRRCQRAGQPRRVGERTGIGDDDRAG